jgi:hypothetical protein
MKAMITIAAASILAASVAFAQPGPGMGGKGPGPNCGSNNTHGWSIMTPEERTAHCNKMMAFKTREECVAYQKEHHKQMEARAKEKGAQLPGAPRHGMCERMK